MRISIGDALKQRVDTKSIGICLLGIQHGLLVMPTTVSPFELVAVKLDGHFWRLVRVCVRLLNFANAKVLARDEPLAWGMLRRGIVA